MSKSKAAVAQSGTKPLFARFPHIKPEMWNKLSSKEQRYFRIMNSGSGLLNVVGKPGTAKSAMIRNIADTLGFSFIVHYLSTLDETDVGIFPTKGTFQSKNGTTHECMKYVAPNWAYVANESPTIVVFEELPLASDNVRKAVLGIINERVISHILQFNDQVLMASTGNLGIEDGTDGVNDMSSAIINRMNTIKHTITIDEWIDGYAADNVHPDIVGFIKKEPKYFLQNPSTKEPWCSPRTWTYVSNYIKSNFDVDQPLVDIIDILVEEIQGWVGGPATTDFCRYLEDRKMISIKDIIDANSADDIKKMVSTINRSMISSLVQDLNELDFSTINDTQHVDNIITFLGLLHEDERGGFLRGYMANMDSVCATPGNHETMTPKYRRIIQQFKSEVLILLDDERNFENPNINK